MAHPQHDSQRAVPQPFLFSEWNIPSISLKDNSQQPSFFPPVVVHRLRQELAGAQKKLEEYEDIIASLYVVLYNIQGNVCHICRERISSANPAPPPAAETSVPFPLPTLGKETNAAHPQSPSPPPNPASLLATLPVEDDPSRPCMITASVPTSQPDRTIESCSNSVVEGGLSSQPRKVTDVHAPSQPSPPTSPESIETSLVQRSRSPAIQPETISPAADISNLSDWSVTEFNKTKPALKVQLERTIMHENSVLSISFSPDGTYLAVGLVGGDGRTFIYDVKTQGKICVLTDHYEKAKSGIESLRFSPDGKYLATGGGNGRIKLWELVKKRVRNVFRGHENRVTSIDFSPNSRFLVSSSDDKTTRIWFIRDGTSRLLEAGDHASFSTAVRFSPYGQYIATVNYDEMLRIWNFRTNHLVEKWRAHTKPLLAVTFTPDGYGLVSGSRDGALKYWDFSQVGLSDSEGRKRSDTVEQKKEVLEFNWHTNDINSISISPDGQWIVSGSDDQTVCIWDTSNASLKCTLLGHKRFISSVAFSPAGNYLACGSWDNCVTLWKYDSEA